MRISIVSPIYKGEKMLEHLVSRCETAVEQITDDYEIVLVNDCSPDSSWQKIREICERDKHVKGVDLSRNFGQHPAISTGLKYVTGDWVVVMDCDLQDRPEDIPALFTKVQEGWDIVFARRAERHDSYFKQLGGRIFHWTYNWLSGQNTDRNTGNFSIFCKSIADEIACIPDMSRSFDSLIHYIGFKTASIDVIRENREEGTSGYSFIKLLKLAFDSCIANTNKPLKITIALGIIMSIASFMLALYNVIAKFVGIIEVDGFTTTVFSIWFVGGLILFVLGVIGLYIGKIYDQVKGRPYAVVRETLNIDCPNIYSGK